MAQFNSDEKNYQNKNHNVKGLRNTYDNYDNLNSDRLMTEERNFINVLSLDNEIQS